MRTRIFVSLFILVLAVAMSSTAFAAKLKIVNGDGAGEGFNDPTPAAPVGGNKGKTVGQQRQLAFEYAANIWGSTLPDSGDFQVRVFSRFDPSYLHCDLGSAGLGGCNYSILGLPRCYLSGHLVWLSAVQPSCGLRSVSWTEGFSRRGSHLV